MRDDLEVIKAVKWCWDNGITIFPVISPLKHERPQGWKPAGFKTKDKVRICLKIGTKEKIGDMEYDQDDKLYKKIEDLYMHMFDKRNK